MYIYVCTWFTTIQEQLFSRGSDIIGTTTAGTIVAQMSDKGAEIGLEIVP